MGRNKYSQSEFDAIARLLSLKGSANRAKQKEIRHQLRVGYEFNISDFNEPGKAFGLKELLDARQRDRERDETLRQQEAVAAGEQTDWKEAMKQWEDWEAQEIAKIDK